MCERDQARGRDVAVAASDPRSRDAVARAGNWCIGDSACRMTVMFRVYPRTAETLAMSSIIHALDVRLSPRSRQMGRCSLHDWINPLRVANGSARCGLASKR